MKKLTLLLTAAAVSLASVATADEQTDWVRRVFQAAQCLMGRWQVEGRLGQESWRGEWLCSRVPGELAYYMTCSGARAGASARTQRVTLLSGCDPVKSQFIERDFPALRSSAAEFTKHEKWMAGAHVTRRGPDAFVWESPTREGQLLTLTFRRIEAGTSAARANVAEPEEVPARPVEETDDDARR